MSFPTVTTLSVSKPSIDVGTWGESNLRATDYRARLGSESVIRRSFICVCLYARVCVVNEIIPASSARFPWLNNRSRDRSPPRLTWIRSWMWSVRQFQHRDQFPSSSQKKSFLLRISTPWKISQKWCETLERGKSLLIELGKSPSCTTIEKRAW